MASDRRLWAFLFVLEACQSPPPMDHPAQGSTAVPVDADVHSFARPWQVVVRHLDLELTLDFERRLAHGTATLRLERPDPKAPLALDSNGLRIDAVVDADSSAALPWWFGEPDPVRGRPVFVTLAPSTRAVAVRYATTPGQDAAMQWLQPSQTSSASPFLFTQGQAIWTRTWIPLQDTPAVRLSWNATIHAPTGLRPLMSAMRSGGDSGHGYTFSMAKPVPSYLIALACGDVEQRAISDRCAVWAERPVVERAAAELADIERMVQACEQLFGPYRWGRYDVLILPPSFPFGGMENPCLTFATPTILAGDKSLVALIAHELAHSWSGNLVTNATWRDFWLNEGFTVYLEQRIMAHVYGEERAKMEIALAMRDLATELRTLPPRDQVLHIDLAGRNPDDGMTGVPYEKGAALLRRCEQLFGRERFDKFLRRWFDEHAFTSVTTAQFERALHDQLLASDPERAAALALDDWLRAPGLLAAAAVPEAAGFEVVDQVRAQVLRDRSSGPLQAADGWSTQQWLRFLRGLEADQELLAQLDAARDFTHSGNAEILTAWLELAIAAGYQPATPALEEFLLAVGRRKFLKPLYEKLLAQPGGRERALAIYERARPRYHAVAVRTLDDLLGYRSP